MVTIAFLLKIPAVGANPKNHFSELDHKIYLNADIYIDNWTGAKKELAGLENMGVRFKGEIGNVITGDLLTRPNRISVFQSLGKGQIIIIFLGKKLLRNIKFNLK